MRKERTVSAVCKNTTEVCSSRDSDTNSAFRTKELEKGKSEADIERAIKARRKSNTKVYRNVRVEGIVWNGEDPAEMFEYKPRGALPEEADRMVTVAEYFKIHHNMPLRFPRMPLLTIKGGTMIRSRKRGESPPSTEGDELKSEWRKLELTPEKLPIEFFSQAWSKVREVDHNPDVLNFNDEFTSTNRMKHLQDVKNMVEHVKMQSGPELSMLLQQLHLTTDLEPTKLTASVLPQPLIIFQENEKVPNDGSWNLTSAKFTRPAFMSSFAIVDFADVGNDCEAFDKLFEVMATTHGIEMPRNVDVREAIRAVIVPEKLRSGFEKDTVSASSIVCHT